MGPGLGGSVFPVGKLNSEAKSTVVGTRELGTPPCVTITPSHRIVRVCTTFSKLRAMMASRWLSKAMPEESFAPSTSAKACRDHWSASSVWTAGYGRRSVVPHMMLFLLVPLTFTAHLSPVTDHRSSISCHHSPVTIPHALSTTHRGVLGLDPNSCSSRPLVARRRVPLRAKPPAPQPKRHGDSPAASTSSPADTGKEARRLASRRHAREYAKTLSARKTEPEDLAPVTVPAPLPTPTDWVQPDPEPKVDSPPEAQLPGTPLGSSEAKGLGARTAPGHDDAHAPPVADAGGLGSTTRASALVPAPLPPTPAMPDVFSTRSRRDSNPLPGILPYRKPAPSAVAPPARPWVNSAQPERAAQGPDASAQRPRRESFLRYAAVNSGEPADTSARPRQRRVSLPQAGVRTAVPVEARRRSRAGAVPETRVPAARPEGDSIRVPFSWTRTG